MPTYEFECKQCSHKFNLLESVAAHAEHREKCPKCASSDIHSLISVVNVKTSKKS
jgi:putative FmdB family regulatory protein